MIVRQGATMRRVRAVSALIVVLILTLPALADKANSAYKAGVEAEVNNKIDAAYEAYKRAYDLKPKDPRYLAAYARLRFRAASEHVHRGQLLVEAGHLPQALAEFLRATEIDSTDVIAQQQARRTQQMIDQAAQGPTGPPESPLAEIAEHVEGPVELRPVSNIPITLRMTETSKLIYTSIGSLVGINVLFDPEYTPRKISIELNGVTLNEALAIVALASKTFWRPVTPNTIYVAADSTGKRKEAEQSVIKTFYLSNVSATADLSDAANTIKSILDVTRVQQVASQNALIVRATPDQLVLVEKLLSDIDKAKAECVIDVAILEVSRDRLRTLGTTPPTSTSVTIQPSTTTSSSSSSSGSLTFNNIPNLNATNFLVSVPSASFTFLMSDSNTKLIQNPQVRVLDNQKATLKIGERVPIATGSFSPGVGGGGINALVNTQFQYIDVGVNIDITPRIHSWREVTLKIVMEVSSVTGQENIGGVTQPIIGQRRIEHETRLREGEVNLLGGMLEDSESDSISGYPWLAKIPILRYLFGQNQKSRDQSEIVFAITPHIVRAQEITAQNLRAIDVGTPGAVELRRSPSVPKPLAPATTAPAGPVAYQRQAPVQPQSQPTVAKAEPPPQPPMRPATAAATQPRPTTEAGAQPAAKPPSSTLQNPATTAAAATVPTGSTTLSFEPTTISQPVGSTFDVNVSITGAQNVFSIPLQINYDPKLLQVLNVSNGGFLGKDEQPVALVFRADTAKGTLQITGTRPPKSGGVSGSGPVFVLTLLAQSVGESVLDISGASVLNPGMQASPVVGSDLLITVTSNEPPRTEDQNSPAAPQPNPDQDKQKEPARSPHASNQLRNILHSSDSQRTLVTIETDRPVAYKVHTGKNPERIYLDLKDAHLVPGHRLNVPEAGDDKLQGIRVAQFDVDVARVVLDLQKPASYSISRATNPDRLIVALGPVDVSGAQQASVPQK